MAPALVGKKNEIEKKIRLREFVFGVQDGLISTVGLLSGMSAATQNRAVVIITGIAAALTGGMSMATGSYLSTRTEKDIFEKEFREQEELAADQPYVPREALLESLEAEGLDRPSAYKVVQLLSRRRDLLLRTVEEKVLGLGSADLSQPFKAATVMFISFFVGAAVPIAPYLFPLGRAAMWVSWGVSVATLLAVGIFKGLMTRQPLARSGFQFASVALLSAAAGWAIGLGIQAASAAANIQVKVGG